MHQKKEMKAYRKKRKQAQYNRKMYGVIRTNEWQTDNCICKTSIQLQIKKKYALIHNTLIKRCDFGFVSRRLLRNYTHIFTVVCVFVEQLIEFEKSNRDNNKFKHKIDHIQTEIATRTHLLRASFTNQSKANVNILTLLPRAMVAAA